jgi:hypothetical protein
MIFSLKNLTARREAFPAHYIHSSLIAPQNKRRYETDLRYIKRTLAATGQINNFHRQPEPRAKVHLLLGPARLCPGSGTRRSGSIERNQMFYIETKKYRKCNPATVRCLTQQ